MRNIKKQDEQDRLRRQDKRALRQKKLRMVKLPLYPAAEGDPAHPVSKLFS